MNSFNLDDFFEVKMNRNLENQPHTVEGFDCVFQFEISDRVWNLDLFQAKPKIVRGAHSNPDCTITMTAENFEKMIRQQLNIPMAIVTGKIRISGDKTLALKLGKLFA